MVFYFLSPSTNTTWHIQIQVLILIIEQSCANNKIVLVISSQSAQNKIRYNFCKMI